MYSGLIDRRSEQASLAQALIAEARRRQRDRKRRFARLILALALVIAVVGPHGNGEILRWIARTRHMIRVTAGALRATWG